MSGGGRPSLRLGAFVGPFHPPGVDPTWALRQDLDLIRRLDELGFEEAWVGEHHSGGWALISSPEVFIAAAAERTHRIRFGTGVISLPFHHPLMVATRLVQLDHQTRGRVILGVGAGGAPTDSRLLGIAPGDQRRMTTEALPAIVHLLTDPAPLTVRTDWFELRDAVLQLRPYTRPCFDLAVAGAGSERGMRLAGRYGLHSVTFAGRPGRVRPPLRQLWAAAEDEAAKHGQVVDRANWRLVANVHVAETRARAIAEVRDGMRHWFRDYLLGTLGDPVSLPEGREIEAAIEADDVLVGSPDDVTAGIQRLLEETGGFGRLLVSVEDWASPEHVRRSFELLASAVAPRFSGALDGPAASQRLVADQRRSVDAHAGVDARRAAGQRGAG